MKTIVLMRHAKSEPSAFLKSDFERKIIERGISDVKKISTYFLSKYEMPQLVLSSSAMRTKQTIQLFLETTDIKRIPEYIEGLYHAQASKMLDIINEKIVGYDSAMIVGHNFGISQLANILSSSGAEEMSTSSICILEFKDRIMPYEGKLIEYIKPKLI
ncbi:MAG TPA: hypothetical protein VGF79_13380 [Bacteroidia bacterium]